MKNIELLKRGILSFINVDIKIENATATEKIFVLPEVVENLGSPDLVENCSEKKSIGPIKYWM